MIATFQGEVGTTFAGAAEARLANVKAEVTRLADSIHGDSGWEHNSGCEGEPDCFACIVLDLRRIAAPSATPTEGE